MEIVTCCVIAEFTATEMGQWLRCEEKRLFVLKSQRHLVSRYYSSCIGLAAVDEWTNRKADELGFIR